MYEHGEKSAKFFLKPWKKARRPKPNPETYRSKKKRNNGTQMTKTFYETLFKRNFLQANVENQ